MSCVLSNMWNISCTNMYTEHMKMEERYIYFFWGNTTYVSKTPNKDTMTDQGTDTIKDQVGETMSFIGMSYRTLGEGLFTGREMTQT